jgi:protein SCO1/2
MDARALRWATQPRRLVLLAVASVAVAAGLAAIAFATTGIGDDEPHQFASIVYDPARPAPDFTLTAHTGEPLTLSDLRGEIVAIYFGYTYCPDVCPATLTNFAAALRGLPEEMRDVVRVLMVSVDPERDTVDVLAPYMTVFGPQFTGLTGTPAEVQAVLRDWRIVAEREAVEDERTYLMAHTATSLVLNRAGARRLKVNHLVTVEQLSADLRALIDEE